MNARLYDPMLHRFLAPDNYVQDPYSTQNFNRYGYVLNNPLRYSDPSGEIAWWIIPAIAGVINWATHGAEFSWKGLGYFTVGFASGMAGNYLGTAMAGTFSAGTTGFYFGAAVGAAGGFGGGFVSGFGNALLGGQNFGKAFGTGLLYGTFGAVSGAVIGGIASGINAVKHGRDFWSGENLSRKTIALMRASGYAPGDPVAPTDENLLKAQKAWMPDAPMNHVKNFTVEHPSASALKYFSKAHDATAITIPLSKNHILTGNSSVYFTKLAFSSAKRLFFTMSHEFIHVSQFALLAGESMSILTNNFVNNLMEYSAYSYNVHLGSSNYGGFTASEIKMIMQQYPKWFQRFQFYNFSWTKTVKFTNIF